MQRKHTGWYECYERRICHYVGIRGGLHEEMIFETWQIEISQVKESGRQDRRFQVCAKPLSWDLGFFFFFFLRILKVLKNNGQVFCRMFPNWTSLMFLLWLYLDFWMDTRDKLLFSSHLIKGTYYQHGLSQWMWTSVTCLK